MAVMRNGFKGGFHAKDKKGFFLAGGEANDQLKGDGAANAMNGNGGDDVVIAYAGDDHVAGGTGKDDISGGAGNDTLTGGSWMDASDTGTFGRIDAGEVSPDTSRDTFNAESTLAANGTDTILLYDAPELDDAGLETADSVSDLIDLTDALVLNVTDLNADTFVDQLDVDLALAAALSLDGAALKIHGDTWFNVWADAAGTVAATDVVVKVGVSFDGGVTSTAQEFIL